MNEELNQVNQTNSNEEVKTFTQEEVNRIVSERLNREKGKIDADREAEYSKREAELNTRELRLQAKEVLNEKGLSHELLDILNYSNKDEMLKNLDILDGVIKAEVEKQKPPVMSGFIPNMSCGRNTSVDGKLQDVFLGRKN